MAFFIRINSNVDWLTAEKKAQLVNETLHWVNLQIGWVRSIKAFENPCK